jgi:uncharacterized membrane protein YeaQ/YmgE (transglycosylase-associated protein family)
LRADGGGCTLPIGPGSQDENPDSIWKADQRHGKIWLAARPWVILGDVLKANAGGKSMFHLIWYILIGLVSGVIAKSVMHVHITIFWTIVLGIIGSIIGGGVTHLFSRPRNERYHPAGLIFSTLGAILVLFICYKLKIHFPQVNPF